MEIVDEGEYYAVFQTSGAGLLDALPWDSVDAVLFTAPGNPFVAEQVVRILKPGGLVFAIGPGWSKTLSDVGLDVFSDQKVCLAGKPDARRFLFHALTCTEEVCDACSIHYLTTLTPVEIISELMPFVATGGTVAVPWGAELIEPVVRRHRYALSAREP